MRGLYLGRKPYNTRSKRSYGEIVAGDVLGSGTFGIVYKAELINSDDKVNCAFKRFKTEADFEPQELYNVIQTGACNQGGVCIPVKLHNLFTPKHVEPVVVMPIAHTLKDGEMNFEAAKAVISFPRRLFRLGLVFPDIKPANMGRYKGTWCLLDVDGVREECSPYGAGTLLPIKQPYWNNSLPFEIEDVFERPFSQRLLTTWAAIATAILLGVKSPSDKPFYLYDVWPNRDWALNQLKSRLDKSPKVLEELNWLTTKVDSEIEQLHDQLHQASVVAKRRKQSLPPI